LFYTFQKRRGKNDLGERQTPFPKMRAGFLDRREGIRIKGLDERV
jgi:hypothetical protein